MQWLRPSARGLLIAMTALMIGAPRVRSAVASQQESQAPSGSTGDKGLLGRTKAPVDEKSSGCLSCHSPMDSPSMNTTGTVPLGCTDCHSGKPEIIKPAEAMSGAAEYEQA